MQGMQAASPQVLSVPADALTTSAYAGERNGGLEHACRTMAMSMTRLLTAPATRPTTLLAVVDEPTSTSTCGTDKC